MKSEKLKVKSEKLLVSLRIKLRKQQDERKKSKG